MLKLKKLLRFVSMLYLLTFQDFTSPMQDQVSDDLKENKTAKKIRIED